MKVIAKRPFISSKSGIGNVGEGRIMDIADDYAGSLIKAGLVEEYSPAPALRADRQSSFISPVGAKTENGQSSQADQALQDQTAKKSKRGVKKIVNAG